MARLAGKVAIVTGAAGSLGFAGVRALAAEGARVVMTDLSPAVRARAEELRAQGLEVLPHVGDVTVEADVAGAVALATSSYGRLDVLWNNAGTMTAEWLLRDTDVLGVSREHFLRSLELNAGSVLLGCKHAVPAMLDSGGGSIINTSSVQGAGGDTALVAYGTGKAAVDYLTRSVATSFGHRGIRCNAIAPGLIPPSTNPPSTHQLEDIAPANVLLASQMLTEPGTPADIANTAVFLASDESRFITGQVLYVDGGVTGHLPTLSDRRRAAA
ncbi:NAD(P)-dependent dehydrogenase (short-subunit alcohol dehydrogenase family) [Crossiella equi]|uniref:NAD(P)-dependent dehydrogenase (Short-subunit alcohol dehydrogenase family) n=1 Tax=Crossiella equi TaxID=130796 RepID=A0ABS5A706_9PSEU|nr:SDR family oxidoreductase [Crossiella equi]MBP2472380.1 NAD(P)-dependent dehydrogenase (short-subunit alcohol dehydrogenase family) [Crossiella equi]